MRRADVWSPSSGNVGGIETLRACGSLRSTLGPNAAERAMADTRPWYRGPPGKMPYRQRLSSTAPRAAETLTRGIPTHRALSPYVFAVSNDPMRLAPQRGESIARHGKPATSRRRSDRGEAHREAQNLATHRIDIKWPSEDPAGHLAIEYERNHGGRRPRTRDRGTWPGSRNGGDSHLCGYALDNPRFVPVPGPLTPATPMPRCWLGHRHRVPCARRDFRHSDRGGPRTRRPSRVIIVSFPHNPRRESGLDFFERWWTVAKERGILWPRHGLRRIVFDASAPTRRCRCREQGRRGELFRCEVYSSRVDGGLPLRQTRDRRGARQAEVLSTKGVQPDRSRDLA